MTRKKYYKKYLQSPHWKEKRAEVIDATSITKDGEKRCHVCLTASPLHIHHLTYENIGNECGSDLKALCPTCHGLFHSYSKKFGLHPNMKQKNKWLLHALRKSRDIKAINQKFNDAERMEFVKAYLIAKGLDLSSIRKKDIIIRKKQDQGTTQLPPVAKTGISPKDEVYRKSFRSHKPNAQCTKTAHQKNNQGLRNEP